MSFRASPPHPVIPSAPPPLVIPSVQPPPCHSERSRGISAASPLAPKGALVRSLHALRLVEMTRRGKNHLVEMTNKVLTFNKLYHDKERNRKIHRAAHRIDSIGDTDGTGGYLVHGSLKKKNRVPAYRAPDWLFYFTTFFPSMM